MEWSTRVYNVYLKYIAPSDVHNYSIDEVLMDVTNYLDTYKLSARQLAVKIIQDVLETTGITATAGIGTNLHRAKRRVAVHHIGAEAQGQIVQMGVLGAPQPRVGHVHRHPHPAQRITVLPGRRPSCRGAHGRSQAARRTRKERTGDRAS